MADNEKKGPRDISDLKARLGLKKQPGGVPAPGPATGPLPFAPAPGQTGGLPKAITGMPAPGAVPPPPGFQPPPEAAPPPPDPRRDPFAAQQAQAAANLAAFYGLGQQLPGDASAVKDEIKKPKPWGIIGIAAGLALGGLIIGYYVGTIEVKRATYDETTQQAVKVRDEVERIQKQVKGVAQILFGKELSQGGVNFDVIQKLKEVDFKEPEMTGRLFKTNYMEFEPGTVKQLFDYYNDSITLGRQLQRHAMMTLNDRAAIENHLKNAGKEERRLGVILDFSQKTPFSQLVELVGPPICPEAGKTDCPPTEMKFAFRTAPGGATQTRVLKGKPQDAVFAMAPTDLQQKILSGDINVLAFEAYRRRNKDLVDTLARLAEEEKQLIGNLKRIAERPKISIF